MNSFKLARTVAIHSAGFFFFDILATSRGSRAAQSPEEKD
jgi:hypothetical protein